MIKKHGNSIFLFTICSVLFWLEITAGDIAIGDDVFYTFRLPRVMAAVIAGAGLSLSGLAMQTLFRNPLAGPFLGPGVMYGKLT